MKYLRFGLVASAVLMALVLALGLMRHWHLMTVQTSSMEPAIHRGSLVVVGPAPQAILPTSRIASHRQPGGAHMIVTHRIVGYDAAAKRYWFKGDANPAMDDAVPAGNVIGLVNLSIPYLGYVCNFMKTPLGLTLGVYFPAGAVILYEISRVSFARRSYRMNT